MAIRFNIQDSPIRMRISESITVGEQVETYDGEYIVTPKVDETQTLQTQNKKMVQDVTVLEIPYAEVSNAAGGETVTIGG